MFKAIKLGKYDFPSPFWDDVDCEAKDMIGCLLVTDAAKRYSAEQVRDGSSVRFSYRTNCHNRELCAASTL